MRVANTAQDEILSLLTRQAEALDAKDFTTAGQIEDELNVKYNGVVCECDHTAAFHTPTACTGRRGMCSCAEFRLVGGDNSTNGGAR